MAQVSLEGWQESRPSPNPDANRLYREKSVYHVASRVFLVSLKAMVALAFFTQNLPDQEFIRMRDYIMNIPP